MRPSSKPCAHWLRSRPKMHSVNHFFVGAWLAEKAVCLCLVKFGHLARPLAGWLHLSRVELSVIGSDTLSSKHGLNMRPQGAQLSTA